MKKTKVYRPRRGLRFTNGRRGVSPPAGFVAGPAVTRTRPHDAIVTQDPTTGAFVSSLTAVPDLTVDTVVISGSLMRSIVGLSGSYEPISPAIATSSVILEGSISQGRRYEQGKLDAILLGQPVSSVGSPPYPSPRLTDSTLTGTFESPSWTHSSIGFNQAFVVTALSSSHQSNLSFNTFTSGSEQLESSAVPAFRTINYSKEQRLQKLVVKKTASVLDTVIRSGSWVPQLFAAGTGALITSVTGGPDFSLNASSAGFTLTTPTAYAPCSILIPVNVSGRLVDLRVWFEMVVNSGSGGTAETFSDFGLAIRSPNLVWGNAHPIRNDPQLKRVYTSDITDFSLDGDTVIGRRNFLNPSDGMINNFYRNTFLLWESPGVFNRSFGEVNNPFDGGLTAKMWPTWQTDRGMRTIFADGAQCPNPRHLNGPRGGNYVGSPNSAVGFTSSIGAQVPWTSDATVPGGATYQAVGSPPKGWLNGAGGKADVNEWPTTGVNYGTNEIKPLYPLLDGIFQTKTLTDEQAPLTSSASQALFRPDLWKGFRPGLRGTEISGTWEILIAINSQDAYYRQIRLEFVYETPSYTRVRRRDERRRPPVRPGTYRVSRISGSDIAQIAFGSPRAMSWDCFFSDNFVVVDEETQVNRSFGIDPLSGTSLLVSDSALQYRLSGSLAALSGSTPGWLFSGPFGMPIIPESSASLVPLVPEPISVVPFSDFMQPRRTLDFTQRLSDVASDVNPQVRLRDLATRFVSSSAT